METLPFIILLVLSQIVIQIGLTTRRKIIEKNKLDRIEKFKELNNSKVETIGNYEEKSKNKYPDFLLVKKRENDDRNSFN